MTEDEKAIESEIQANMDYPADLREFTVSGDQYLVIREARKASAESSDTAVAA